MKRLVQLVVCLVLISTTAFAGKGGFGERLFFQVGGTIGADVLNMTGIIAKDDANRPSATSLQTEYSSLNVNYATLILAGRINFLEMTTNSALSLNFRPSASFGRAYNSAGGGNTTMLRLPFTIECNSGAASTASTRAKTGFAFGGGAEYVMYPLGNAVSIAEDPNGNGGASAYNRDLKCNWLQPVVYAGVKFFGKHYYCREINFKASFSSISTVDNKTNVDADKFGLVSDFKTVGLMISFLQYINY